MKSKDFCWIYMLILCEDRIGCNARSEGSDDFQTSKSSSISLTTYPWMIPFVEEHSYIGHCVLFEYMHRMILARVLVKRKIALIEMMLGWPLTCEAEMPPTARLSSPRSKGYSWSKSSSCSSCGVPIMHAMCMSMYRITQKTRLRISVSSGDV